MNTAPSDRRALSSTDELFILDLLRERSKLQRAISPLLERMDQLNARLRAAIAAHEAAKAGN